jgi:membrane-associated phospholipid phosphatase
MILLDTQINILLQNLGLWLLPAMKFFSFLGSEYSFILIIPAVYWCFNSSLGIRLGLCLIFTNSINSVLKIAFHLPRPYWMDSRVIAYTSEPTFGFPSGHAQKAASVWGMLGFNLRNRLAVWAAGFLIFMIGLSRLYLGAHFSIDVLAGWLFGFIILLVIIWLDAPISRWISRTPLGVVFFSAAIVGIIFLVLGIAFQSGLQRWPLPNLWVQLASRSGSKINPISLNDLFSNFGSWIGFIAGLYWLHSHENSLGKFRVEGSRNQKIWRYLLGISGVLFLWAGLGLIIPQDESIIGLILRFVQYGLVGGWISGLAPYVFFKTKLISPQNDTV